jgi:hypothetical protein
LSIPEEKMTYDIVGTYELEVNYKDNKHNKLVTQNIEITIRTKQLVMKTAKTEEKSKLFFSDEKTFDTVEPKILNSTLSYQHVLKEKGIYDQQPFLIATASGFDSMGLFKIKFSEDTLIPTSPLQDFELEKLFNFEVTSA